MLMKRPILPRIIGLLCLYAAAFVVIGAIQFARQDGFTRQVGDMQISGHYKTGKEGVQAAPGEAAITGKLSVFFGGLEFLLAGEENGRSPPGSGPAEAGPSPEYMGISGNTAVFRLSGGGAISFTSMTKGDRAELQIRGDFLPDVEGFSLPYKPLRTSRVEDTENGLPLISARGRVYAFSPSVREKGQGILFLENGGAPVSYRVVPEELPFSPGDYTLGEALSRDSYGTLVQSWRDRNYSIWARSVRGGDDENLVLAFLGEAVSRGTYQNGKSLVSSAFLNGNRRGYGSSLYLGGAARTYPALGTADRERLNRLAALIDQGSPEILGEARAFEYLGLRGSGDLLDRAAALVRDMDPSGLRLELVPGVFEGFSEIKRRSPQGENPFGNLSRQACLLVSEQLHRVSGLWNSGQGLILVFPEGIADTEFNLRLGKALALWAEAAGDEAWAAVGRSLVLSVLSLENGEGSVPRRLSLAEPDAAGGPTDRAAERLDSSWLYRILQPGEYYPRIADPGISGIWVWTCSPSVSASRENGILDISVSFPAGETHYVMIWGLEPFNRMQLHSMDWRSDPRYESYDSSGWVYYPRDQLLVVKMKHRVQAEHIRLYYSQPAPATIVNQASAAPALANPASPGTANANATATATATGTAVPADTVSGAAALSP
jgi:hypothetical protein